MTVWPSRPLPPVRNLHPLGPYRLNGDVLKLDLAQVAFSEIEIPDELYLRELKDIDLDDPEAIVAFTNTFGRLGHSIVSQKLLAGLVPISDQQRIRMLGHRPPDETSLPWDKWFREIDESDHLEPFGQMENRLINEWGLQHVDTFRSWALSFRHIADVVERDTKGTATTDELVAAGSLLDKLLEPFYPSVIGPDPTLIDDYPPHDPFADRMPRLENILALQVFNHIAAGDVYQVCENETCRPRFVHQQGRSRSGRHRGTGVIYCSTNCADSQASREYHRRKKAEKGKTKKGDTHGID